MAKGTKTEKAKAWKVLAYDAMPANPKDPWPTHELDGSMHMTHNFTIIPDEGSGPEQATATSARKRSGEGPCRRRPSSMLNLEGFAAASASCASLTHNAFLATIEPMHGNQVVVYRQSKGSGAWTRLVLDEDLHEGHALAIADFLGLGRPQIVAGWRLPNSQKKVGIKLYVSQDGIFDKWQSYVLTDQTACGGFEGRRSRWRRPSDGHHCHGAGEPRPG